MHIFELTLNLYLTSVTSHTAPNAQIFKNCSAHDIVFVTVVVLASSIIAIFNGDSRDKTYPLSQSPSSLCPHIKSPICGLTI